nr:DUF4436 family protein [Catenulispora pinistramenti]
MSIGQRSLGRAAKWGRRRLFATIAVIAAVVAAVTVGIWLQVGERLALDKKYALPSAAPDRIDVAASIQRVDATGRELTLRVMVTPRGAYADPQGLAASGDLVIQTSAPVRGDLKYPAHARISTTDVAVALSGGAVTDYPFDGYDTDIEFTASFDGRQVPVSATLSNVDVLFATGVDAESVGGTAVYSVDVARSNSVVAFALFMMAAMWALAIAVAIGTRFLVRHRKGLTWPALGWMAASLFALAAFRNTAPGNPPIGSVLDYAAFLWAEAIIAVCVIVTVVSGNRVEGAPGPVTAEPAVPGPVTAGPTMPGPAPK